MKKGKTAVLFGLEGSRHNVLVGETHAAETQTIARVDAGNTDDLHLILGYSLLLMEFIIEKDCLGVFCFPAS